YPGLALLRLFMAHLCLKVKNTKEAASHLYFAENLGTPDELLLVMKARFCEAIQDETRADRLRQTLAASQDRKVKEEEKVQVEQRIRHSTSLLTNAWLICLMGLISGLVGLSGVLLAKDDV